ncbi:SDR family oxidoreductase [Sphingomonas sp. MG17]|uniref:SDR family oxidoreductase n=1 Tax=Sphingomonas tagetis TaxID=2949092 RepID=A0A9X2KM20_9SPHN|nr:SDR family oxidoreductase [Sphingomonas tagetis]MCP3731425.1 SDR family oxidoreductase [Sphingomonas tagetis]
MRQPRQIVGLLPLATDEEVGVNASRSRENSVGPTGAKLAQHCMLPRLGLPEDMAKAVAFLAWDDAFYITAQLLRVDGALLDHAPQMAEARRNDGFYQSQLRQY